LIWRLAGVVLCLLVAGAAIVIVAGRGGDEPQVSTRTLSAEAFVGSIGVNTHLGYADTAYADHPRVLARLDELGVRHFRDSAADANPLLDAGLRAAAQQGLRGTLIADPAANPRAQVARSIAAMGNAIDAFEGPNELDNGSHPGWVATLTDLMPRLGGAVSAQTDDAKLIGPSFIDDSSRSEIPAELPGLFNAHPYAGGDPPEPALARALEGRAGASGARAAVFTETGYHSALEAAGYHTPVSEATAAVYLPRALVTAFGEGARRTFVYELADSKPEPGLTDPQQHFGLLRNDLSPKPGFMAIQTLIRAVNTSPGSPRAELPSPELEADAGDDVEQLSLSRRDGSLVLALWRPVSVWDDGARRPVDPGIVRVKLVFGGRDARDIQIWRPSVSPLPVQHRTEASELGLALGGDLVLVSLR
jgi:hypothetical protein